MCAGGSKLGPSLEHRLVTTYFQATIELRGEHVELFCQNMKERVLPIVERVGWKLIAGFMQSTGRFNTVVDIWQLDDLNHYERGLQALTSHPDYPVIAAAIALAVERETVVFMNRAPYLPAQRMLA